MDGKNDFFVVSNLENSDNAELIIFDRYGKQLYLNSNYKNNWNGIDQDGNPLPDDTYFYHLKSEGMEPISGFIVVRRGE